jgi:hypothetical protein
VTGGSQGIGFALAQRFAAAGHDLLLVARQVEPLQQAAQRLRTEFKVRVAVVALDVTAADAIAKLDAALAGERAYADLLINSAGIGLAGAFEQQAPETLLQLLDVNVRALTALSRHYLPGMLVRGRGGILNLASIGAYTPGPYQAAYYASKSYVLSFSEALAAEVAGQGVRVCVLAPGPVQTSFHARMGADRSAYRLLVPPASADAVGRAGYLGYILGRRVVVPGILNPSGAFVMRIMPHRILIPIVGWLLRPRGSRKRDVGR